MSNPLADLADLIGDLCDPHQHTEPYEVWDHNRNLKRRHHRTTQPGLLQQLRDRYDQAPAGQWSNGGTGSRAPLAMEALSRYIEIQRGVDHWATLLELEPRPTAESRMRSLVSAAARLDDNTRNDLHAEVRTWHRTARIVCGWTTPPFRPRVACPIPDCGKRDGLRIHLDDKTALCGHCGATWDAATIGVLADYIRGRAEAA